MEDHLVITTEQRTWANSIIQKFMDGARVATDDFISACVTLQVKPKDVRRAKRLVPSMRRGFSRGVILTPTGGKVAA